MRKYWKMFRFVALGGVVLQGCPIAQGLITNIVNNGLTWAALEFLADNNGIFDLFADG